MIEYITKIVISGKWVEIYQYEIPSYKNTLSVVKTKSFSGKTMEIIKEFEERRQNNVYRARTTVRRLVNSNPDMQKFLTLTFADEITDLQAANYEYNKFIKRLKWYMNRDLKYLVVPEIQQKRLKKTGAAVWHFHLLLDAPYIQNAVLRQLWKNGFVRINHIENVNNVGAYVCKYLGKEKMLLKYQKKFFHSRNLIKPKVEILPWYTELLMYSKELSQNARLIKEDRYDTRFNGKVTCKQYFIDG